MLKKSRSFPCMHKRIIFFTAQLTWNSCYNEISIIKCLYYSLKTTKCLNQFNIHPHDQIITRAPENKDHNSHNTCFLYLTLGIHTAGLFSPEQCRSQQIVNVQFPITGDWKQAPDGQHLPNFWINFLDPHRWCKTASCFMYHIANPIGLWHIHKRDLLRIVTWQIQ